MRALVRGACTIALAAAITGCGSPPASPTAVPIASPEASPVAVAVSPTAVRSRAVRTPASLPTVVVTPTIMLSPTITPTLGPPTATATPAPGEATLEAAQNIDQALVAFAQARAGGDTQATLDAQRKLLDSAAAAAPTAAADQTSYGQQLRSALDSVQSAAAGDSDKLNDAHQALVQIEGSLATPVAIPRSPSQSQQSLTDVARSLKSAVDAYTRANNGGNSGDLLRAQRDLLDAVANAETATKNAHSPVAQQIQNALTSIHDGLAGDTGKLQNAANDLSNLQSGPSPTVNPTASPISSPTASPTTSPTASVTPTVTPTASPTPSATNTP